MAVGTARFYHYRQVMRREASWAPCTPESMHAIEPFEYRSLFCLGPDILLRSKTLDVYPIRIQRILSI